MALGGVISETVKALLLPRRLIPITLVCLPLLAAQGSLSEDPLAIPLGLATCIAFVGIAPVAWRALFPEDREVSLGALRLLAYAAIGVVVVGVLGILIPQTLGMGTTFLSSRAAIGVTAALFLVGGWGLGRDVGLEASLVRERARAAAFAREAEHAQLLALRAHLDPHFLFNTLNAIAEWCREDAETAERAVLQLSSILRAVLQGVRLPSWPLSDELELCRTLFSLHQMRDPAAFTVDWQLSEGLQSVPVPPMILLPLAENAMKHGPSAGHRGGVRVVVQHAGAHVRVILENPGPYRGPRPGSEGVPTVQRRLALAYGEAATFRIFGAGAQTSVELDLPASGPRAGVIV